MFSAGLKSIYKKISQIKDKSRQDEAFNYLQQQLTSNPYIQHQFELLSNLKSKQGKITTQEAFDSFVKGMREKHSSFLKENANASQLTFWKENKRLFEYFNINTKELNIDQYDAAVDIFSTAKGLNEGIIKGIVKKTMNSALKERKKVLKEDFSCLKVKENTLSLSKQFQIINFLSECMQPTSKKLVQTSLRALQEERFKNYGSCVEKLYKLRLLTEKTIADYTDLDDETEEMSSGKSVKLQDLKFLKKIEVNVPNNWQKPERIILSFRIPVWPIGIIRSAAMTSILRIRQKINRLERIFINSTIYQKNRTQYFDPVGCIWEVTGGRDQINPGQNTEVKVTCYISTNKEADGKVSWEQFKTISYQLLKDFDTILPDAMGEFRDVLTPIAQKEEIKSAKGLSKQDKLAHSSKNGQLDADLLRRKEGRGTDFEDRTDDFGGIF